jgi:hypothetical protein
VNKSFGGPSAATAGTYIYQCVPKGQWSEQDIQFEVILTVHRH